MLDPRSSRKGKKKHGAEKRQRKGRGAGVAGVATPSQASSWFGGSTTKARATQSDLLELQNNEQLDALSEQVSMLKSLTMEIDTEVREQNTFLENMGATFSGAGEALGKTMTALDAMAKRSGAKFAVAILAIIVLLFLLVWWAFKYAHPS